LANLDHVTFEFERIRKPALLRQIAQVLYVFRIHLTLEELVDTGGLLVRLAQIAGEARDNRPAGRQTSISS
jgi:hypothetical protein